MTMRQSQQQQHEMLARVITAAFVVVVALGAAEQVRYRWGRAHRAADRWWADVEHRERDELLRAELRTVAGELVPVIGSRFGRPRS